MEEKKEDYTTVGDGEIAVLGLRGDAATSEGFSDGLDRTARKKNNPTKTATACIISYSHAFRMEVGLFFGLVCSST